MAKKKYICTGCHKCTEPCTVELSGDADMTKDPTKLMHCGTWVEVPAEEDTNKQQLPKLTVAVFSLPDCPLWAKYAAVDDDGKAYWYDEKPTFSLHAWSGSGTHFARRVTKDNTMTRPLYDASDWQHSLVERPDKEQRPKLTVDVFSLEECPEEAKYAAVDADGTAYWYEDEPEQLDDDWQSYGRTKRISLRYDAADWKNSLIERRTKLTEEIFNHPECPADAVVAVVNSDGTAAWGNCADIIATEQGAFRTVNGSGYGVWTPIPGGACFDATDWKHGAVYKAGADPRCTEPAPLKLTYDVFSCSNLNGWTYVVRSSAEWHETYTGCPEWARYAAVNKSGAVYVYENKPVPLYTIWTDSGGRCAVVCTPDGQELKFDAADWRSSLMERPAEEHLPKLTTEVFSLPDCPAWAQYAAVDADGDAYWYSKEPPRRTIAWGSIGVDAIKQITRDNAKLRYDSYDWQHSLIARPVAPKLTHDVFSMEGCPDWARYAAVDENGSAYWYEVPPRLCTSTHLWESNGQRTKRLCHPGSNMSILFDSSYWKNSLIERQPAEPRQKLTTEVFYMAECPEWARYAAVDHNGMAYWYDAVPYRTTDRLRWENSGNHAMKICYTGEVAVPLFDATDWEHSLIESPTAAPLPKLTVDVFSSPQCPAWARYVAVDADGVAWYYGHKPRIGNGRWDTPAHQDVHAIYDACKYARFDAADWQHSLIERPASVPDWFKPGVLAYNNYTHTFFHVTASTEYSEKYLEARVRPYNDNELESLFGQSVLGPNGSKLLVTGYNATGMLTDQPEICVLGDRWLTAEDLLTYGSRPQGIKQYHSKEGAWIDCGLGS